MAIPLIQNVEKQDINTSIIAIRRQLEQLYNALGVTENTVSSEDISKSTGTPLGTWASFVNDSAPNGEWLESGSTFNANTYPALAMMLGGNVVPIMYDHSRLGEYEAITITSTEIEMQYDGVLVCTFSDGNNTVDSIAINGTTIAGTRATYGSGDLAYIPVTVNFKKGDRIKYIGNPRSSNSYYKVAYYSHPMFIKAVSPTDTYTPPSSEIQQIEQYFDNGINTIKNNGLSYSTTETLTGGKWIDGKPIYRKVLLCTSQTRVSTSNTDVAGWSDVTSLNIEQLILAIEHTCPSTSSSNDYGDNLRTYFFKPNNLKFQTIGSYENVEVGSPLILEYTKTTD